MADLALINTSEDKLKRIQGFDAKSITRESQLGTQMGFQAAVEHVERVITVFTMVSLAGLSEMPSSYLNQLNEQMDRFFTLVSAVVNYNPEHNRNTRMQIINQWEQLSKTILDNLAQIISYQKAVIYTPDEKLSAEKHKLEESFAADRLKLQERADAFERQFATEKDRLSEKELQLDEALNRFRAVEAEFTKIKENLQEQAAESGITQEAKHFDEAATNFGDSADNWRTAVFILTAIVLVAVICSFLWIDPPQKLPEVIHYIASKIMVFGTLFFLLGVSVKSYMYNMHNKVVNQHRKNALLSYRALIGGAEQAVVKDRVLEYAAVCIYTHQDTGYLKGASSKPNSIVEIMPKAAFEGKLADPS